MFVSQPAVSMQITNLENELGVTLFLRGYRSVTPDARRRSLYDAVKGASRYSRGAREASGSARATDRDSLRDHRKRRFRHLFTIVAKFRKSRATSRCHRARPDAELLVVVRGKYDMVIQPRRQPARPRRS